MLFVGRLLRTLSKEADSRSIGLINSANSSSRILNTSPCSSSGNCNKEGAGTDRHSSVSTSSFSYEDNIVDMASCSDDSSPTRPNSIYKIRDYLSSSSSIEDIEINKEALPDNMNDTTEVKVGLKLLFCSLLFRLFDVQSTSMSNIISKSPKT